MVSVALLSSSIFLSDSHMHTPEAQKKIIHIFTDSLEQEGEKKEREKEREEEKKNKTQHTKPSLFL